MPRIPLPSIVLGYGPMLPLLGAAALSAAVPRVRGGMLREGVVLWGGTILAFVGGVRRGLSFRQRGGPAPDQMFGMFRSFVLALAGLALPWRAASCVALAAGFADIAVNDPKMARRGEAPPFFAELRGPQMAIATASLLVLAVLAAPRKPA